MTRLAWLLAAMACAGLAAQAQKRQMPPDTGPKTEVSIGYSYSNIDGQEAVKRQNGHGWGASFAGNFHRNIGVVLDLGGHYGHANLPGIGTAVQAGYDFQVHEALGGLQFFQRFQEATPFFHVLFGVVDTRVEGPVVRGASRNPFLSGISSTDFAMGIGGGVDVNLNRRVAIRVFQLDWIPVRGEPTRHDIRGKVGFTFKFY